MPPPPIAMPADRDCRWPPPSMSCTHYVHNELWAVLTRPPCVFPAKCLAFFKGHHLLLRSRKEQIPRGANGIIRVEGEGGARHCTPVSNRKHRRFATTGGSRLAQFPIEFTGTPHCEIAGCRECNLDQTADIIEVLRTAFALSN